MIMGCLLVRQIPLTTETLPGLERGPRISGDAASSSSALLDDSRTRLLGHDESDVELDDSEVHPHQNTHEHTRSRSLSVASSASAFVHPRGHVDDNLPNIFGARLWKSGDFWLLFTILSIRTPFFS